MQSVHVMHEERSSYTTYGAPPFRAEVSSPQHNENFTAALSREASARAMNPPAWEAPTKPPIREAELPADFASIAAKLDREIVARGVGIDSQETSDTWAAKVSCAARSRSCRASRTQSFCDEKRFFALEERAVFIRQSWRT
jgi:hypothetical protein